MGFTGIRRAAGAAVVAAVALATVHVGAADADAYSEAGQQMMEYCRQRGATTSASTYKGVQLVYVATGSSAPPVPSRIRDEFVKEANELIGRPGPSGSRRINWVYNGICQVSVRSIAVSASTLADKESVRAALVSAGFNQSTKKYIAFVEGKGSEKRPTCGWTSGNVSLVGQDANNSCWWYATMLHELFHQLGGVVEGAPNYTSAGGGHVTDLTTSPRDLLDTGAGQVIDHNNDDYYYAGSIPSDAKYNWVRTHNLASSPWLSVK